MAKLSAGEGNTKRPREVETRRETMNDYVACRIQNRISAQNQLGFRDEFENEIKLY